MKVSYSKLLVHGVIATTLLMSMSCQKKGSARGIQPQTQTKVDGNMDLNPGGDDAAGEDKLNKVPGATTRGLVKPKSGDPTEVTLKPTSGDSTTAKQNVPAKTDVVASSEVVSTVTKTTPTPVTTAKECSDEVVEAQQDMSALFNKIATVDKVSTTPAEDKKSNYTAYANLCLSWAKLFEKEKITTCLSESVSSTEVKPVELHAGSWLASCYKYGSALKELTGKSNYYSEWAEKFRADRVQKLKEYKLAVSDEAKEMFTEENIGWKNFLVDGEIQTDSAKLTDAIKAGKVACTISKAVSEKMTSDHNVIVSVTKISQLVPAKTTDEVQSGMILDLSLRAELKEASAEDNAKVIPVTSKMTCSALDIKDVNLLLLKKVMGAHFMIQKTAPAATTSGDLTKK